jgi:glucose/arabinose dehydrogenase/PKD repeat protein
LMVGSAVIVVGVSFAPAATLPADFEDTLVASMPAPTALAFTPDGRLLITTQPGQLRVYMNGALLASPALNLSARLCTNSERGLLGVAVDPAFASNRFIYLYYTFKKSGVCEQNTANSPVNRVVRVTLSDANTVDLSTEQVLIDNIPSFAGNHNGGDLKFGRDGFLYVSVGDGGCDYNGDSGCQQDNNASRDEHVLVGKILRITASGGIPASNPFQGTGSVRCNVTGRASPGQRCQETFARGLRNPFRMAFDPNATGTTFYINDVGQNTWEEINLGTAGADYGWNVREGHCAAGSTTDCGAPPAGMTNPIYDYLHASGCASITGGAFVPNGVWPAAYNSGYLFSDYVCGTIFLLSRTSSGGFTRTTFATGLGGSSAVTLLFGPHQGTQALYYTSYANGGQVRRIATTTNRAPVVTATATPVSGAPPLAVHFDGSGTTDPDGDTLAYDWDFDDGSPHAATAIVNHTYSGPGRFDALLTVHDSRGASAVSTVTINVGNNAPVPTITSPAASALFAVGQTITLTGSATDPEDGALAANRLSWTVLLHHNTHTHPFLPATSGNNITFQAPAPEDLAATASSYLEIQLTATDSAGLSTTRIQNLQPRIVNVTIDTDPPGLGVVVNSVRLIGPTTVKSWQNYALRVDARTETDSAGSRWLFSKWSDGGAAAHIIVTPSTAATVTARFAPGIATTTIADTYVRGGPSGATNYGLDPVLLTKLSGTADSTRQAFLKFDLGGLGTVGTALLRVYGAIDDTASTNVPVAAYPVANTSWTETTLTGNNRPANGSTAIATATIVNATAGWYEWNITQWVRSELAAGRTTGAIVLKNLTASSSRAQFNSRQAAANRPEIVAADTSSPSTAGRDVVMYAGDAAVVTGAWTTVADASAAGGTRLHHPDAGAAKVAAALASPVNYFDVTFTADAKTPYRLWIRGRADQDAYANDSVFVQFSDAVTATGAAAYRINTTGSTTYVLEACSGCGEQGWGWQDNGYGTDGALIYFAASGTHTIRIQTREDGLSIDQIVLSPSTYLNVAPGAAKNDSTIVPR